MLLNLKLINYFAVLGIKPETSCMLGKGWTTELQHQH
jgi:hypothetical protein